MLKVSKYYAVAIGLLIAGCAPMDEKRKALENSLAPEERAYVIGKFSTQCFSNSTKTKCTQTFNLIDVHYKSTNGDGFIDSLSSTHGGIRNNSIYDEIKPEFEEKSFYFCRVLPEGEYAFYDLRYWNFAGGGSGYSMKKADHYNVSFNLKSQTVTNIDQLKVTTNQGLPGHLELRPLSEEEVQLALDKCPAEAKNKPLVNAQLWSKTYPSSFVKSVP